MNTFNEELAKTFLVHFSSPDHLKKWVGNFLDLWFPDSFVDPESNSSPIQWMYEVYKMYEKNEANNSPEVLVISSRSSYKTLSEAVFAIIAMLHFKATIAHMAAIVPQASAAQNYIERFLLKIKFLSTAKIVPIPLQFSQAPSGELKENILGSSSDKDILSIGQENFSENKKFFFSVFKIIRPLERFNDCSILLYKRVFKLA
jgi:hypothetical protein